MNVKHSKQAKKTLTFYKRHFGFTAPYTVVTDLSFCVGALESKVQIRERLDGLLRAEVAISTTKCAIAEAEQLIDNIGAQFRGPSKMLQSYKVVSCKHSKPVLGAKCLKNTCLQHGVKYLMATRDKDLQESVRSSLHPVPLINLTYSTLMLEEPPAKLIEHVEMQANQKEEMAIKRSNAIVAREMQLQPDVELQQPQRRKRKGPKQPNPLSCKKKRPRLDVGVGGGNRQQKISDNRNSKICGGHMSASKKKRKKKKKKQKSDQ